jgi:hypothetical protein
VNRTLLNRTLRAARRYFLAPIVHHNSPRRKTARVRFADGMRRFAVRALCG